MLFIIKMVRKTTSLKIDEELWKEVKIHCIKNSLDISEYLESLIKLDLKKSSVLLSIKDYLSEIQEKELSEYKNTVNSQKITFADLLNKGKNP